VSLPEDQTTLSVHRDTVLREAMPIKSLYPRKTQRTRTRQNYSRSIDLWI